MEADADAPSPGPERARRRRPGAGPALIAAGQRGTLLSSIDEGRRWSDVSCGPGADLRGVALRDDGEALCARGGLVAVGDGDGRVHTSRDGGASWESHPTGSGNAINALWLGAAGLVIAAGDGGLLAVSEDEGRTWKRPPLRSEQPLYGVWSDDHGAIWCIGSGPAFRSTDGGKSFAKVPVQAGDAPLEGPWVKVPVRGKFRGLWVAGPGRVVLVGDGGSIAQTHDGGQTWARSNEEGAGSLIAVWGSGERILVVGGGSAQIRSDDGGHRWIEVTGRPEGASVHGEGAKRAFAILDGVVCRLGADGLRWIELGAPREPRLRAVWAGPGQLAVAVGRGGTIVRTVDGGDAWEAVASGCARDLEAIWGRGDELFAVGGLGLSDVLRSRDGGATWEVLAEVSGGLRSIWGDEAGALWACGREGVLLRSTDGGETLAGRGVGHLGHPVRRARGRRRDVGAGREHPAAPGVVREHLLIPVRPEPLSRPALSPSRRISSLFLGARRGPRLLEPGA